MGLVIGGLRRAVELLGVPVTAYVSCEIDKPSNRVICSAWPEVVSLGDLRNVTLAQLEEVRQHHPRLRFGLGGCGFPAWTFPA